MKKILTLLFLSILSINQVQGNLSADVSHCFLEDYTCLKEAYNKGVVIKKGKLKKNQKISENTFKKIENILEKYIQDEDTFWIIRNKLNVMMGKEKNQKKIDILYYISDQIHLSKSQKDLEKQKIIQKQEDLEEQKILKEQEKLKEDITVSIELVDGINFDKEDYIVSIVLDSKIMTEYKETVTIKSKPLDLSVVFLSDLLGTPFLMAYDDTKKDNKAELSVESSAVVFVLKSPRFYGQKFTDITEITKRIKAHKKFQELVFEMLEEIQLDSPCPMSTSCNMIAANVAEEIAQDLYYIDLVEKEQ